MTQGRLDAAFGVMLFSKRQISAQLVKWECGMETDVLAFGERLIAAIPVLRVEAGRLEHEHDAADRLVRITVAQAWRRRAAHDAVDLPVWLTQLMACEYAAEPRSFGA